jgi:hypothetical protein
MKRGEGRKKKMPHDTQFIFPPLFWRGGKEGGEGNKKKNPNRHPRARLGDDLIRMNNDNTSKKRDRRKRVETVRKQKLETCSWRESNREVSKR